MAKKIYEVSLRFALDKPLSMAEPGDWHWESIINRIVGAHDSESAGVTLLKVEGTTLTLDAWIKNKGATLRLPGPEARQHLADVWAFAESINKLDRLVRALDQACFPTFFGQPARTTLVRDSERSFYFEISPQAEGPGSRCLMNGGVIFHEEYREGQPTGTGDWSVHT